MNKYKNKQLSYGVYVFDSKKEAKRFYELSLLEKAGEISNLQRQVKFEVIPTQRDERGKCIEKACSYIADFTYWQNGSFVVEDVKGYKKGAAYRVFAIKRKLMLQVHGIRVKEV